MKSSVSEQKRILFVVNPKAGKRLAGNIAGMLNDDLNGNIRTELEFWRDKNDFGQLRSKIVTGNYDRVVAVGGDGTVNKVASAIAGTRSALGIIPAGSGNGLARSLGISMDMQRAVEVVYAGKTARIDYGVVNDRPFFCTSGVGFDALIGEKFARLTNRGLRGYIVTVTRELFRYRASSYSISIDGNTLTRKAFLITIANAGQYGNDFYIAPEARMDDGKFHIVILHKFYPWQTLALLVRILRKQAHRSKLIETFTGTNVTIVRESDGPIHYDGEPETLGKTINYSIVPGGINIIS